MVSHSQSVSREGLHLEYGWADGRTDRHTDGGIQPNNQDSLDETHRAYRSRIPVPPAILFWSYQPWIYSGTVTMSQLNDFSLGFITVVNLCGQHWTHFSRETQPKALVLFLHGVKYLHMLYPTAIVLYKLKQAMISNKLLGSFGLHILKQFNLEANAFMWVMFVHAAAVLLRPSLHLQLSSSPLYLHYSPYGQQPRCITTSASC